MDCKACKEKTAPVSRYEFESAIGAMQWTIKKLWIIILVLIGLLAGTNGAWIWYESTWETVDMEIEQKNERGINSYIGNDGDIYYGYTEDPYTQEGP